MSKTTEKPRTPKLAAVERDARIVRLKANAYDLISQMERAQRTLQMVNAEIAELMNGHPLPPPVPTEPPQEPEQ